MANDTTIPMPEGLEYWTADEVAECLDYTSYMAKPESDRLYARLWSFISEAENPTPLGGDGSNGTVETPCGRLSLDNDDKAGHWWHRLEQNEQKGIAAGMAAYATLGADLGG